MSADDEQEEKTDLEKEEEAAQEEVAALEEDPPENLEDWPDGAAKYKTFGGPEGDSGYDDGPTAALGKSDVRHHEDGSVSVDGEEVDDPAEYKGDPIPGGPTDPDSGPQPGDKHITADEAGDGEGSDGDDQR